MRRQVVSLLGLLCAVVCLCAALAQDDVLLQAEAAYQRRDYETTIRIYESLVAGGLRNGEIYYNLGAAHYQSGNLGRALVNFHRAQGAMPRDGEMNTSIALVRAQRLDVQGDETGLIEGLSALTSGILTLRELGWLVFILWALWFALLSASFFLRRLRVTLRVPLLTLGVVTLFAVLLLASRLYITAAAPSAIIIVSTAHVMSGPGSEYLEIYQLHEAAELRVQEIRGRWARISVPDGRHGWILTTSFEVV
jgi:hypothetical protein